MVSVNVNERGHVALTDLILYARWLEQQSEGAINKDVLWKKKQPVTEIKFIFINHAVVGSCGYGRKNIFKSYIKIIRPLRDSFGWITKPLCLSCPLLSWLGHRFLSEWVSEVKDLQIPNCISSIWIQQIQWMWGDSIKKWDSQKYRLLLINYPTMVGHWSFPQSTQTHTHNHTHTHTKNNIMSLRKNQREHAANE